MTPWVLLIALVSVLPNTAERVPAASAPARLSCVTPRDSVAEARLQELVQDSSLAREMITHLCSAPAVTVLIETRPGLRLETGVRGQAQFYVADETLVGEIAIDSGIRPSKQLQVIAHEMAHALELALLPRAGGTRALATELLSRLGRHRPWMPHARIETPFAVMLEARVAGELKWGRPAPSGTLARLARTHGLSLATPPEEAAQ